MAAQVARHGLLMRQSFSLASQEAINWFPGHMAKGLTQMQQKLRAVDCVVEVHDARIPLSGRNPLFEKRLGLSTLKPHLLVMNKMDLADPTHMQAVKEYYDGQGVHQVLFTNCKEPNSPGIKRIINKVSRAIKDSERYNRSEEESYNVMVIGIPNVGKSSLINALRAKHLRRSKATRVGATPGITQSVMEKIKVCEDPKVYLVDTPGVLTPRITDLEMGLKLALAATIKDHLVGEDVIADYLLYRLNLAGNHKYVQFLGLDAPTDTIQDLLISAALRNNWVRNVRDHRGLNTFPDTLATAARFIRAFRTGVFGRITLDHIP
ncbi:mitochondrial ribosome-associated GTPase 1-like [Portunus trituberculatus]|uniref:mitochondrial ribosome-associated GTPase 1-like n=1 Tax=Portunus trituberculatus TaxID=210409 RepID=UPI001E1D1181|nr:mitochondrial ribosome-associated GTPase 1-like [Portunus trituberculatus]